MFCDTQYERNMNICKHEWYMIYDRVLSINSLEMTKNLHIMLVFVSDLKSVRQRAPNCVLCMTRLGIVSTYKIFEMSK